MKNNKKINFVRYFQFGLVAIGGLFIGWLLFHSSGNGKEKKEQTIVESKTTIWTCAMHPQIRKTAPGKCPICGMDLVPLNQGNTGIDPNSIQFSKEAAALANVLTSIVTRQKPVKEVRLYGKVQADERLLQSQVAQFPGRIDKLLVNFTGETVKKGQTLALIYSPELVTAQQELLEAAKTKQSQPAIYEAAKEKLQLWKLTESQISAIENSGSVKTKFEIVSTTSGMVSSRRVNTGDYVSQGTVLFDISDLSNLWLMFDAYESDLPFLNIGDRLTYTLQSMPGVTNTGKIIFIDPVVDPLTRVLKVRVETSNQSGKLKPEMFATGIVQANMSAYKDKLVIPKSAVLWTGKRSIVYVKQPGSEGPVFKIREIGLGPMLGNSYVVTDGLVEGEEIVTQGTFSVDAAAQLEGKPSMMNPSDEQVLSKPGIKKTAGENPKVNPDQSIRHHNTSAKTPDNSGKPNIKQETFHVSGLCDLCKKRIEKTAKAVNGVKSASWDLTTQQIRVKFDQALTSVNEIEKAISLEGHDTEKFKADDKTYESLPKCCHYRK